MIYDIAIIGAGAAGTSAAVTAKVLNKSVIWLAGKTISKKVERAENVQNYLGLPSVTGAQLGWTFKNHAEIMGAEIMQAVVTGVYETQDFFTLLAGEADYQAKTVILCLGVEAQKPIAGEEEFLGRGVSYCATCDGNMYKGKTVAIYCTDKIFEHEIEYLLSLVKKAYVFPMYKDCAICAPNAEIILKTPQKICGDMWVRSVEYSGGKAEADGVFILKSAISPSTLVHGLATEGGHIIVNRACETNIAGIFAAGDCTGRPYQYIKAAGEGNVAVHSAVKYLSGK